MPTKTEKRAKRRMTNLDLLRQQELKRRNGGLRLNISWVGLSAALTLVFLVGFYYPDYVSLAQLGYPILAGGLLLRFMQDRTLSLSTIQYIVWSILFIIWVAVSSIWAYDSAEAITMGGKTLKVSALALLFLLLLNTRERYRYAMEGMAIAGVISGIVYLQYVNLADLASYRLGGTLGREVSELPNYNVIAMYVSFSCIYYISKVVSPLKMGKVETVITYLLLVVGVAEVMFFGSRKSIFALLLAFLVFFFFQATGRKKLQLLILVGMGISIILIALPWEYVEYVFDRIIKTFTSSSSRMDHGDRIRIWLFENAVQYFSEHPVIGNGYWNFMVLMGRDTGIRMYSHNNFLELLADLGVIGFFLYYSVYVIIIKYWNKTRRTSPRSVLMAVLIGIILFNSFFIVILDNFMLYCILALLFAGCRGFDGDEEIEAEIRRTVRRKTRRIELRQRLREARRRREKREKELALAAKSAEADNGEV